MATHSSILAWEIHGQGSLMGYSPCGPKRIRHDLATKQQNKNFRRRIINSNCMVIKKSFGCWGEFFFFLHLFCPQDFPGGSDCKESACNAGDLGSVPGLGRAPGGGHGNSLQYSCLENSHGQRSLVAIFHGITNSWTQTEQLSIQNISHWR